MILHRGITETKKHNILCRLVIRHTRLGHGNTSYISAFSPNISSLPLLIIVSTSSCSSSSTTVSSCLSQPIRNSCSSCCENLHQWTSHVCIPLGIVEGSSFPEIPEPASTTYSVHVLVHIIRHVVVNNVSHPWNIQSSGSNSSSYQDWHSTHSEIIQGLLPLSLQPITMDACGWQPFTRQIRGQEVCISLGLNKYQAFLLGIPCRVLH